MNMKHWKNYSSWHWKKESKNLIGSHSSIIWYLKPWSSRDKCLILLLFFVFISISCCSSWILDCPCCFEFCFCVRCCFGSIQSVKSCSIWSWAYILQILCRIHLCCVKLFCFCRIWVFPCDSVGANCFASWVFWFYESIHVMSSHVFPRNCHQILVVLELIWFLNLFWVQF